MDKEKTLKEWPLNEFGGPELNNLRDAINYASLVFIDTGALEDLYNSYVKQETYFRDLMDMDHEAIDFKLLQAFNIQFIRDCMRKIVLLRHMASQGSETSLNITEICPFCQDLFSYHDGIGNCPIY